jgi:hypothetical protein
VAGVREEREGARPEAAADLDEHVPDLEEEHEQHAALAVGVSRRHVGVAVTVPAVVVPVVVVPAVVMPAVVMPAVVMPAVVVRRVFVVVRSHLSSG